ncbi:TRAP transporter substrate-binding protein [Azoarcus sp. L1K30]|uniref:TRAP transporter substrate-binding protein n=1 Tax=Azoarcus sp. L1K30 TaxID=2820277 RepID=UPI001B82D592|nr:TRAP transporter substrate-binding protein [Azoarcus sp. L1K30]MBR0564709.1 TRAP transporter substrate-binding protein [Azoarcus sp. L1K30]
MKRRLMMKTLLAALAVVSFSNVQAADFSERSLKLGIQNPKGHPAELGAQKLADIVSERSGGKIRIKVFAGGVLGGDQATVSALAGGTVDMTALNSGILSSHVKEMGIYDFPFLFGNAQEADAVVDGPFGKALHAKLAEKGIIGLAYWELGFRNITNSVRPITKVEDIAGLKLRVIPNPINLDWVKALGANPVPLAWPEVYTALEQKAVDGQENPVTVIAANKLNEVQKYLTLTRHVYNPQSVIISKKTWDTFSDAEKKLFSDAAAEASAYERKVSREQESSALEGLKKAGMQVTELAPAEIAKLREKMKPVIAQHAASVGTETVDAINAELAKLRK